MNIYESIAAVMNDIGAIGKNSKNQQQGFMFRGIDAVMNALAPALIKNKMFVVPEILEQMREERTNAKGTTLLYSICRVKYTFYAEDGSSVSAVVVGEGMDTGDKATNKAMSIAFKYACFQTFCIPTEEMIDPDAEVHEVKPKTAKKKEPVKEVVQTGSHEEAQAVAEAKLESVTEADIETLRAAFAQNGIDEAYVLQLYGVPKMEFVTRMKYDNMLKNLEKIKAKQEEKKHE